MTAVVSRTSLAPLERVKMELMVRANAEGGGVESYFFLHPIVKRIPVGNPPAVEAECRQRLLHGH